MYESPRTTIAYLSPKDIQGRNRSIPVSGVPAKLISTLSVGPIAVAGNQPNSDLPSGRESLICSHLPRDYLPIKHSRRIC